MPVEHYENFPVASLLMPPALREPVVAIYGFARNADDIADEGDSPPEQRLRALEQCRGQLWVIAEGGEPDDAIHTRLARAIRTWSLPLKLFHDLLDAFAQDVVKTRYANDAELRDYCRRSADPIGRLLLCLYGVDDASSLRESDAICSALQLINHWQDIAIDLRKNPHCDPPGRIYVPLDVMARHGVSEEQLRAAHCDERFRAMMKDLVDDARQLMRSGMPLARRLPGRIGWELRLIVQGGLRILQRIEQVDYDVFRHRPQLGRSDWPLIAWKALSYR
ncbi:squalene synthase HpnC [Methyloversatilis thermotolerans]|uniref:squalene synthase HpnC n=1 Tax=Methyloversatilis thermotolerans TaxID=1346290 RepID=UPI00037DF000|nr:squalene synthase HpnC [Methyloversatilis thermotolerans]